MSKIKNETIYYNLFEIFDNLITLPDTGTGSGPFIGSFNYEGSETV
jgi:hypothetical protein